MFFCLVNKEMFHERDRKDEKYLGLLKDLKVESVDAMPKVVGCNVLP